MILLSICQVAAIISLVSAENVSGKQVTPPIAWPILYLYIIVTFNTLYDIPSRSLSEVACWREGTGFEPNLGWKFQQDAVGFIGIDTILSFSSAQCLSCWKLEYGDKHMSLLAIDSADSGFVMSLSAMQSLTDGQARKLGRIEVKATQVDESNCGLSAAELHAYDF